MEWRGRLAADLAEQLLSLAALDIHAKVGERVVLEAFLFRGWIALSPATHVVRLAE